MLVHGDDFVSSSERSELEWLCRNMQKKFETKIVMAGDHDDLAKKARVLHQIVMWHPRKGPTYEADQHAEIFSRETGAEELNTISTPVAKETGRETEEF